MMHPVLLLLAGTFVVAQEAPVPRVSAPPTKVRDAPPAPVTGQLPLTAVACAGVDLQAEGLRLRSDYESEDSLLLVGRVACTGSESVQSAHVAFYRGHPDSGGSFIGQAQAGPWLPGEVTEVALKWGGDEGTSVLWCFVDAEQTLEETDEENNCATNVAVLITGVPFVWQEVDGFCHYASQGMLFNSLGYSHTVEEVVETNLVPYSPIYFGNQFAGYAGVFVCQTITDMEWNGAIRNLGCSLEVLSGWSSYLVRLKDLVDSGVPAETSVDPYYLPQPDWDPLREYGIHSGHGVVVVGYGDSAVVMNDPGVGLAIPGEEALPDPHLRGKNVVVPLDLFRLAVEQTLGTSFLLLSYEPEGTPVTRDALLLSSLDVGLKRLAGDTSAYDPALVQYLQPASPAFGREAFEVAAQDMSTQTFEAWYQYFLSYFGGDVDTTLAFIEASYWSFAGLTGVGLLAPVEFYHSVAYQQGQALSALSEDLMFHCDSSCTLFGTMLDDIGAAGGSTVGIEAHLDSLRVVWIESLALEDSVASVAAALTEWLSQSAVGQLPPTSELSVRVWPIPYTGQAWLLWTQPTAGRVCATLYDVSGRRVATIFDGFARAGSNTLRWQDVGQIPPAVYLLRLTNDQEMAVSTRVPVVH
jgi:hypothetical protein